MEYEARIKEAIKRGEIRKVVVIDDAFDPPSIGNEDAGPLLDFLEDEGSAKWLRRAGVEEGERVAARQALLDTQYDNEALQGLVAKLYAKFVEKFDERFDPSGRFTIKKGDNLRKVRPLLKLLGKCTGLTVTPVGSGEANVDFGKLQPEVVFVDYFLGADLLPDQVPGVEEGNLARGASLRILSDVLDAQSGAGPSVMLMSSHAVRKEADKFRQQIQAKQKVFASRFQFLAKDDLEESDGDKIAIAPAAADALLDIAQRHRFAGALEDALTKWRDGVNEAVGKVWDTVTDLEMKDYAYLSRFRLADEGQPLSSYLEWFFGEVLIDSIARSVKWSDKSFTTINEGARGNKPGGEIDGAFDGPTEKIAELFYRARFDQRPSRQGTDMRMGDVYFRTDEPDELLALLTPDCDLIKRPQRSANRATLVAGRLNSISAPDSAVSDFFRRGGKSFNVKWDTKDVRTLDFAAIDGSGDYKLLATLRPLYAFELQQKVLTDLGRVGLAVAPAMAVMASAEIVLRGKPQANGKDEVIRLPLGKPGKSACAVFPKRGGEIDKSRILYQRRAAEELVRKLLANLSKVHDDAKSEAFVLKAPAKQMQLIEKLCRDGQKDGEDAFGIRTTLGPEAKGKMPPWCQVLIRFDVQTENEAEAVGDPVATDPTAQAAAAE